MKSNKAAKSTTYPSGPCQQHTRIITISSEFFGGTEGCFHKFSDLSVKQMLKFLSLKLHLYLTHGPASCQSDLLLSLSTHKATDISVQVPGQKEKPRVSSEFILTDHPFGNHRRTTKNPRQWNPNQSPKLNMKREGGKKSGGMVCVLFQLGEKMP